EPTSSYDFLNSYKNTVSNVVERVEITRPRLRPRASSLGLLLRLQRTDRRLGVEEI
ncbi:11094_t:CDS:2, partial [Gigaspora rosea]